MYAALLTCTLLASVTAFTADWDKPRPYRVALDLGLEYRRMDSPGDNCAICFAELCVDLDKPRCDLYLETTNLVTDDDDPTPESDSNFALRDHVDTMLRALVDKGLENYKDCVPLISQYTDCTKDNICSGCKTCTCDNNGQWNCTDVQKCRPNSMPLNVDHHTLLVVLQNLREPTDVKLRRKRSLHHSHVNYGMITRAELSKWLYGTSRLPTPLGEEATTGEAFIENNDLGDHHGHSDEIFGYFVNSIVNDALPQAFKDNQRHTNVHLDRFKRWVKRERDNFSAEDINEWLTAMRPEISNDDNDTLVEVERPVADVVKEDTVAVKPTKTTFEIPEIERVREPEFLTFEEVLGNIVGEGRGYIRRKHLMDHVDSSDYMPIYDDNVVDEVRKTIVDDEAKTTVTDNPVHETVTESLMQGFTEVVIDLLQASKDGKMEDLGKYLQTDVKATNDTEAYFEDFNNIEESVPSNIMKREAQLLKQNTTLPVTLKTNATTTEIVTTVNVTTVINQNLTMASTNTSFPIPNMNQTIYRTGKILRTDSPKSNARLVARGFVNNVVYPLNDVYNNMQKETNNLQKIRLELFKFVKHNLKIDLKAALRTAPIIEANNKAITIDREDLSNSYVRNGNMTLLGKYANQLNDDILNVLKDVMIVQKFYLRPQQFPQELVALLAAMKHYIHKQSAHYAKISSQDQAAKKKQSPKFNKAGRKRVKNTKSVKNLKSVKNFKSVSNVQSVNPNKTRRVFTTDSSQFNSVKDYITEIFELIDKSMPTKDALEPISRPARKVLLRIIKQYFVDEFAQIGLRVYDPHYNLTHDLSDVGFKWHRMMSEIERSSPANEQYLLKTLYLTMSNDISKLNDALTLINFAQTRRMVPVDEEFGTQIVSRIDQSLQDLNLRVMFMIKKALKQNKRFLTLQQQMDESKKKDSFLKQVKSFLMNSKKDIMELLHLNIPKPDIMKKIAGRKLDDQGKKRLRQLEKTMAKWQSHLNIIPSRSKRSALDFDRIRRRIKNIIPKYLRGKLNPAIANKKLKKSKYTKKPYDIYGDKPSKWKTTKSHKSTKRPHITWTTSPPRPSTRLTTRLTTKTLKTTTTPSTTTSTTLKSTTISSTQSVTTISPTTSTTSFSTTAET